MKNQVVHFTVDVLLDVLLLKRFGCLEWLVPANLQL